MAVVINELEVVLEPEAGQAKAGGQMPPAEKPPFSPQDLLTVMDREQRNDMRLMAH
jgi:hypothetical protein